MELWIPSARLRAAVRPRRAWLAVAAALVWLTAAPAAHASCAVPANEIEAENCKGGSTDWDIPGGGAGDAGIQGYATNISVPQGGTVQFKIDAAGAYTIDIYRMGYYGGLGARLVDADVAHVASQNQPGCPKAAATRMVDCSGWGISASWLVPPTAVSGIYFAKLTRSGGGASHVVFVVRDDDGSSDLLFQTSDTTWQAYNAYGGESLYTSDGGPPDDGPARAYAVSYDRPFTTRGNAPEDWVFNAEYPMVRFLEANGYDVSYSTGVDTDRSGAELLEHGTFVSVGHDEYWSAAQRANVEYARDRGVNLAFFSGNEVFWKTRWETSARRNLIVYKETHANAGIDPSGTWTGTWRDPRSFNAEGARPENGLTGTIFTVNSGTRDLQVPEEEGKLRLWRGTPVSQQLPGGVETLGRDLLGYEWDEDLDNGARPAGLIRLSNTPATSVQVIQDYGSTYDFGSATHHLTLYRAANGAGAGDDALVFGAGTIQWAWGLDADHDRSGSQPDPSIRQATVNLFADMGAQPRTLQAGLSAASASTDLAPPSATITSPAAGTTHERGSAVTIRGTATDAGGKVGGVEVSTDGGTTWHPADGRAAWSYTWTPQRSGPVTLLARAADDSANLGAPSGAVPVNVGGKTCPCSLFGNRTPAQPTSNDASQPIEVGVEFTADQPGVVTALRYHEGADWTAPPSPRTGHLRTADGGELASVNLPDEPGAGWRTVTLPSPVRLTPGATYVVSYFSPDGNYANEDQFFAADYASSPLHVKAGGGAYAYAAQTQLPNVNSTANYWADVVFAPDDNSGPLVGAVAPADGATGIAATTAATATFDEAVDPTTVNIGTFTLRAASGAQVPATVGYDAGSHTATLTPSSALAAGTVYTASVTTGVTDTAGNALAAPRTWSFTTAAAKRGSGPRVGNEPADKPSGRGGSAGPRITEARGGVQVSTSGAFHVRVACATRAKGCRIRVRARRAGKTLAERTVKVRKGKSKRVLLVLSSRARTTLARKGSMQVAIVATTRNRKGRRATTRVSVRLIAPGA